MTNLMNEVARHLNDDVIIQLSKQIGAQDPNQVKKASDVISELLLNAIQRNANNQRNGGGMFGAIKKDHDGGILGNLINVFTGKEQVNQSTMNGAGIINHLLGKQQLEAAQVIGQMSGLDIFKSGVLMQLMAPVVMGVVGQKQKSNNLDLGGLAQILTGGNQNQQGQPAGGLLGKILDRDGDGSMMDDLLKMGINILNK